MDYITKAETLFFARFPEDGDEEPTEADLHEFIGVWLEEASNAGFCFDTYPGWAGHSAEGKGIIAANWNEVDDRFEGLLERAGYEVVWSESVDGCEECYHAVETLPSHSGWKRRFHIFECDIVCESCIDAEELLAELAGTTQALTLDSINPADHGYVCVKDNAENGLHHGMDDDPKAFARVLRERGVNDFIFRLDSTSMFYSTFSVWVKEEDEERARGVEGKADISPAVAMEQALRSIPRASGTGIQYTTIDLSTGTANTRMVTPEEFINGIGKE